MTKLFGVVRREPSEQFRGDFNYENYGLSSCLYAVERSLNRLQLDYIDVLQCHRFDPFAPIEETITLHDIVRSGRVRYIGMSSCYVWQLHAMQNYAISHNLTPFISMQNHYSLAYREEEREMMPLLKYLGVGSIPWSPLARGFLTRPLGGQSRRGETDDMIDFYGKYEGNREVNRRVEELATRKGKTMAQIALAWVMNKDPVAAPIVGTTSPHNLMDLIDVVHIELTKEEMKYLGKSYQALPVYGISVSRDEDDKIV
ncbi:hypothetical protein ACEPAG_8609 [Sanghuangporus baumii]